jgi:hypothetical protein
MSAHIERCAATEHDSAGRPGGRVLQRKCACGSTARAGAECEACAAARLQRRAARPYRGLTVPAIVDDVLRSPGQALDVPTRHLMEERFGHDFSRVRIHADTRASESAGAVNAHAFTVGDQVVFAAGRFAPGSAEGQSLLAHELTHVVQQRGAQIAGDDTAPHEAQARRAEHAFAQGLPLPVASPGRLTLARQDGGPPPDAAAQATRAEFACDFRTLCQLRFSAPSVVSSERVRRAYSSCHPSAGSVFLDPCLMPAASPGSSTTPGTAPDTAPSPSTTPPAGPGSSGSGSPGGLSLPSTNVRFSLGPAQLNIDLPASLAARLPVPFRGAERVVFALNASPSEFSFTATINAVPHVRIIARASATTSGAGSAGITVETTQTRCQAADEAAARSALQSAGERLRNAILAVQNPPPVAADAGELARTFDPEIRLGEVVAAIANVNSAIERVRSRCREVPVASFEFGVRGPLSTPGPEDRDRGAGYVGGTATFHF